MRGTAPPWKRLSGILPCQRRVFGGDSMSKFATPMVPVSQMGLKPNPRRKIHYRDHVSGGFTYCCRGIQAWPQWQIEFYVSDKWNRVTCQKCLRSPI